MKKVEQLRGILPEQVCQNRGVNNPDKLLWGPFKKLPNVRNFRVLIQEYDPIFLNHGIMKRLPADFQYENYTNRKFNKYMEHQLKRMSHATPQVYWAMANQLIKRSNVFLVMSLNHVYPKWQRNMGLSSVVRLALEIRRIAQMPYAKLDYKRVYIEKANKQWRPLGVPTPTWRVYLHMLNQLMVNFLDSRNLLHDQQHGFRPRRGTLTAWKTVLEKVIVARDIFEFDLKKFFDLVSLDKISSILIRKGIPVNLVRQLYYINASAVKIKGDRKLNEFEHMMKRLIMNNSTPDEVINHNRPISYMYRLRGVPQGANTSPLLASLILEDGILNRGMDAVMYADDGIYYGDLDQPIITPNSGMLEGNIYFNLGKSGWVKKDGIWKKPLKFLGLEYDGNNDILKASTRLGSDLVFDKFNLVKEITPPESKEVIIEDFESWGRTGMKYSVTETDWETFVRSKIAGFIQARLYAGDWNLDNLEQDFTLKETARSFVRTCRSWELQDKITIFNSSSFATNW